MKESDPYFTTRGCTKTLAQMHASLVREMNMRKRVYPGWVRAGRMTATQAQYEIECAESAVLYLKNSMEVRGAAVDIDAQDTAQKEKTENNQQLEL